MKKPKPPKPPKKLTKKKQQSMARTAKRKYLADWSKVVREKYNNVCAICEQPHARLNSHHLIEKSKLSAEMKLDPNLGIALCPIHHRFGAAISAHSNPIMFVKWLQENKPDAYEYVVHVSGGLS